MTPTLYTPIPRFGVGNHPDFSGAFGDLPIVSHQIQPLIKVSIKQLVYKKISGQLAAVLITLHSPHSTVASAWLGCCKYRWLTSAGCNSDCAAQHQDPDEAPLFFG